MKKKEIKILKKETKKPKEEEQQQKNPPQINKALLITLLDTRIGIWEEKDRKEKPSK